MAIARRKAIPRLLARSHYFERPEHAPWSPAGTHTCATVYTRAPAYPAAEGARNDPRPAEQGMQMCKNSAFGTYAICRVSRWRGILFSTSVWWRNPLLHFCMAGLGLLCCRARGQTNTAATGRAVDWFIGLHGYLYCRCYLGGEVSQLLIADNPSHKCVSQIFA